MFCFVSDLWSLFYFYAFCIILVPCFEEPEGVGLLHFAEDRQLIGENKKIEVAVSNLRGKTQMEMSDVVVLNLIFVAIRVYIFGKCL